MLLKDFQEWIIYTDKTHNYEVGLCSLFPVFRSSVMNCREISCKECELNKKCKLKDVFPRLDDILKKRSRELGTKRSFKNSRDRQIFVKSKMLKYKSKLL